MHIVCSAVPGAPPQSGQLTMQQVLVGGSKYSWESADCLLGKTVRRSSVSSIEARHMKIRPRSGLNNIRVPANSCLKALKKLHLRLSV
jgi:hypothetical protein